MSSGGDAVSCFGGGDTAVAVVAVSVADVVGECVSERVPVEVVGVGDDELEAAGHQRRPTHSTWPAGLTDREVDVLRLLARGQTRKQIANQLYISESTVHTHTAHIYEKTGLSNRAGIALFSIENDLIRN